jgi:Tfp pilus assembly protein PilN
MMYTIDLLRGHGIPIKNRRGGVFVIAATVAVPLLIAMVMYTQYLLNKIDSSRMEISIADMKKKIVQMKDKVEALSGLEKQEATIRACIAELPSAITSKVQWSPILKLVVENMPRTTQLSKLNVSLVMVSKQVPDKTDPKRLVNVPYSARTLQISLFEYSKFDNGQDMHDFVRTLRSSSLLANKVDDIRIVKQERDAVSGVDVTRYDIDCIFKPQ